MSTNPTKPVIYWGLFVSPYSPVDMHGIISTRYLEPMGVTSFSVNHAGTKMAHGHTLDDGPKKSIHRKAEDMLFYASREKMELTMEMIYRIDREGGELVIAAIQRSADVQRQHRIEIERVANKHAIPLAELGF
jgi:hypothetical protein